VKPGEPVTIRRLSGGQYEPGVLQECEENLVRIRLERGEFKASDLVEITGPETLYLGEVQGREGGLLIVIVEHSVDRAALAAIEQVWYRPESE
jgi:hypothetical protein